MSNPSPQTRASRAATLSRSVLVLTADYEPDPWSGIGRAVAQTSRALHCAGMDVVVLVAGRPGSRAISMPPNQAPGPRVLPLGRRRFPVDGRRFHAIHLHSLRLAELALELKRRYGLPLLYTVHARVDAELDTPSAWLPCQQQVMAVADRLLFPSESERRAAVEAWPSLAPRARVVPHGVAVHDGKILGDAGLDDAGLDDAPDDGATRQGGPVVFAGRFHRSKGLDLLEALVPWLSKRRVRDSREELARNRVVLAGGHGDPAGRSFARRMAKLPGVDLPGWLPRHRLDALFARAALVLMPSRYEPFGMVALEAMRMAAPVVAADVGGLAEVVPRASRLRSRSAAVWRRRIAHLLDNPASADQLGRQGSRRVAVHFGLETAGQRLAAEIHDVLAA